MISARDLRDVFWPTLDGGRRTATKDDAATRKDVEEIMGTSWNGDLEQALRHAEQIADSEQERRKTAEAKASTCLLAVAALIPILTYVESPMWQDHGASAPKGLVVPILVLGVAYLMAAGLWALRTVEVRNYAVIGWKDLVRIWNGGEDKLVQLVKEKLVSTRYNQEVVNNKISAFTMASQFLYRAMFCFGVLLIVQACFNLYKAMA